MCYLVLDDLSKEEAQRYFVKLIEKVSAQEQALFKADLDCFDFVYSVTGGRIIFLKLYVGEVCRSKMKMSGDEKLWIICMFRNDHSQLQHRTFSRFLLRSPGWNWNCRRTQGFHTLQLKFTKS